MAHNTKPKDEGDQEEDVEMAEAEEEEDEDGEEETVDDEEGEVESYKSWVNQCEMKCLENACNYLTNNVIEFRMHTLSQHNQLFEQYCTSNHLSSQGIWTNLHHIACKMCHAKVVHSQANVDKHMVDEHNITGFQYYKDYIAEASEESGERETRKVFGGQAIEDEFLFDWLNIEINHIAVGADIHSDGCFSI